MDVRHAIRAIVWFVPLVLLAVGCAEVSTDPNRVCQDHNPFCYTSAGRGGEVQTDITVTICYPITATLGVTTSMQVDVSNDSATSFDAMELRFGILENAGFYSLGLVVEGTEPEPLIRREAEDRDTITITWGTAPLPSGETASLAVQMRPMKVGRNGAMLSFEVFTANHERVCEVGRQIVTTVE